MKRYILSIIALTLGMTSAFAQTVSVDDVTIKAGETKVVSINLNNTQTNIVSFQMDLTLPDGITINKAGCALGSRISDTDQELTIGKRPDGSIRLTSTSFALKPITGTSGEIIKLSLKASDDSKGGTATLKKILFATSNSQTLMPTDVSYEIDVSYILTYKVDGEVYKTSSVAYGTALTPEAAPIKEGYTFSGWSEIPETMPAKDVVVTGSFSVNSYTLIYMVDGVEYKSYEINYASTITPEAEPTKEGYTFSGWSEIPTTMPAHDVTITGTFTVNSYTLTYKVDGEVYKTLTLAYGSKITPEAAPTKEGYTFSGWSEIPATMPAHDVLVTGSYTINRYKLTYMVDGVEYKSYEINYASTITPEAEPTKEGYTFSGWSEIPETMPAQDVVVTGTFSINSYTLTYMVDGEEYQSFTVKYRDPITPLDAPEKEGYTFSGWDGLPRSMPAQDVIVKGYFTINSYTITYVLDGEVYATEILEYGAEIVPPVIPGLEDYTIWEDVPETMPANDITIYGKAKEIIDKIISIDNGQLIIDNSASVYDLSGRKMVNGQCSTFNGLRKGINIIRMSDGTTRKVLVR